MPRTVASRSVAAQKKKASSAKKAAAAASIAAQKKEASSAKEAAAAASIAAQQKNASSSAKKSSSKKSPVAAVDYLEEEEEIPAVVVTKKSPAQGKKKQAGAAATKATLKVTSTKKIIEKPSTTATRTIRAVKGLQLKKPRLAKRKVQSEEEELPPVRRTRRWKPNTVARRNIRKYQNSTEKLIRTAPFIRLARAVAMHHKLDDGKDLRFAGRALELLQESTELYGIRLLQDMNTAAISNKRNTVKPRDLETVMAIRANNQ